MKMQKTWVGRVLLLTIALLLVGGYTQAQETIDTLTLNLDKALEIALSDNPTIKVADEEIALKKVAHKETWQSLLPQASLDGTLNHTITAAEMNLGGQSFKMGMDNSNTVMGVLNISLPIFAPGVYKAMSLSKTDIELAVEKSRASRQDLVNQVAKAYYQLMLAQDSYEVLQKSYQLSEENYNIVNAKFQQGAVSEFDKISAEVQMRSIKPNVISANNAVVLSKLQLKVLMGITTDLDIKIDDNLTNYEATLFANELIDLDTNLAYNTTMKQLDLNGKMLKQNIKQLRTNFMPTLGMNYSYQYQSLYNDNWNLFNYNWGGSSSLVFSLSIPLYKASNFTKLKSNRIQMRQLEQNRMDTERKLNMQVTSFQKNMAASSEQVVSNRENVMQAQKAVQIAGKRYEVGKGTVLELNTSQVQLTEAELTYNQSIYDYLVAKADLDQVLGKDYVRMENEK
ncbi:TolC family protein [uncultured Bacteroides sp.]|uniref:TolC family protein n=1 Tax=uncultured Bacteroides sp. TaxID=162156 RepID=UPI00261DF92F|nr:TolC family protein [uncultured Bacteroides sp.]